MNRSFMLLRFVASVFSDGRPSLLAMCLGLLLFQGCALLQRPPDIAAPTGTPAQPCRSPDFSRYPTGAEPARARSTEG